MSIVPALLSLLGWLVGGEKSPYEIADVYLHMRQQVLELDGDALGELKSKPVWAVLMETGYPEAAFTLVAVVDGTASLYFSNGGGIIGAGEHDQVRRTALSLVDRGEKFWSHMKQVDAFPNVSPGNTTFYLVTPRGIFSHTAKEDDLGEGRDKLSELFHQGHALIAQMRTADDQRRAE